MTFSKQSNSKIEENKNEINEHNRNVKKARIDENKKSEQIEKKREGVKKEQIVRNNSQPTSDEKVDKDTQGKKLPKQPVQSSIPKPKKFSRGEKRR